MALSLLAGIMSSLLGVGGGTVKVPAMRLLMNVPMKAAIATSNFMIGVTAAASAYIYYAHGAVSPLITGVTATGAFIGATLGSHTVSLVRGESLQKIFGAAIVVIAVLMFMKSAGAM